MTAQNPDNPSWPTPVLLFLWFVRIIAMGAMGLCAYLAYVTMTGTDAVGCGQSTLVDCESVLSSRYAAWLGVPVSIAALLVYGCFLAATWLLSGTDKTRRGNIGWPLMIATSTTAAAAGAWFITRQITMGRFCPFCLATHSCGLLLAATVFGRLLVGKNADTTSLPKLLVSGSVAIGLVAVAALIVGQTMFTPNRSSVARTTHLPSDPPGMLSVLEGKHKINLQDVPIIGRPDAPTVIVKLFDYTCPHCKKLHAVLEQFDRRYGDRVAVVMAPVPLSAACNRLMSRTHPMHQNACAYARYALAVWQAERTKFRKFHDWMFLRPTTPTPQAARSHAVRLVGKAAFDSALKDPGIDTLMNAFVAIWEDCQPRRVPKILTREHEAVFEPPETIHAFMEEQLGVTRLGENQD